MVRAVTPGEAQYKAPVNRSAPLPVSGWHRRFKTLFAAFLLTVFFGTPWLRWSRGDLMPDQAILFDMPGRRLFVFGFEYWPQDLPIAVGIMIMSAVGLFLVTTLSGRLWCGFTCPHTVWTDLFFMIERRIDRLAGQGTIVSRILRLLTWAVIAALTGMTFVSYFYNAHDLPRDLIHGQAGGTVYFTIGLLTMMTWLLGGFARERVCLYMCPWPRFQSALLDHQSLVVTYQDWRGEPRGKKKIPLRADLLDPAAAKIDADPNLGTRGDCIDCTRCFAVCPTHVDIRVGLQLGCIGCGLCIDACDEVMTKIGRPTGLIRFDTEAGLEAKSFTPGKIKVLRGKVLFYAGVWGFVGLLVLYGLFTMRTVNLDVESLRSPPYVLLSDGSLRNDYTLRIAHRLPKLAAVDLRVDGLESPLLRLVDQQDTPSEHLLLPIGDNRLAGGRLTIMTTRGHTPHGHTPITLTLTDPATGQIIAKTHASFWGP